MDHLETVQERHDRWHARHVSPIYVTTRPAQNWNDLLLCQSFDRSPTEVLTLPFDWLLQENQPQEHNNSHQNSSNSCIREILDLHGFLVVSGVLNQKECDQAIEYAWDFIEAASDAQFHLDHQQQSTNHDTTTSSTDTTTRTTTANKNKPPVHRQDPSTVASPYFPKSLDVGGLIPYYGSGHCQLAWYVRSNPKVVRTFQQLHHGETDLLSSLDAMILWRGGIRFRTNPGWFHVDQNPRTKPGPCCIQGLVNLLPTNSQTGGNVMVAQSQQYFPHHYTAGTEVDQKETQQHDCSEFYQQRLDELEGRDFMEIDPNDQVLLGDPTKIISCMLQPGDMLLWDSRTVHCSYPAATRDTDNDDNTSTGLIRAATIVSMRPASGVAESVLQQRKLAVNQGQTLTHWVNKYSPFFDDERSEKYKLERASVKMMKQLATQRGVTSTLLAFDDLTPQQQDLVVGKDYENNNKQATM